MSASKRIVARRLMQNFFKDEKAFKAFLEHGIIDGGFVGLDRPQNIGPMESAVNTRLLAALLAPLFLTGLSHHWRAAGLHGRCGLRGGADCSVPRKKGIGSTIIQDKG